MKQPEIKTQRLLLRRFNSEDADDVQELAGNYNVSKTTLNIPYPYGSSMAEEWIGTHLKQWESGTGVVYAITIAETGQLSGAVSMLEISETRAELGYWIGEPYWGRGYCTEAAKALIQFSFERLGLKEIIAEHLHSNPASGRVMEKAGMHHIGTTAKEDRYQKTVDVELYEIQNT